MSYLSGYMIVLFFVFSSVLALMIIQQNEIFRLDSLWGNLLSIFLFLAFTYNVLSLSHNFVGYLTLYYAPLLVLILYLKKRIVVIGNILCAIIIMMYLSILKILTNELIVKLAIVCFLIISITLLCQWLFKRKRVIFFFLTTFVCLVAEFVTNYLIDIKGKGYSWLTILLLVIAYGFISGGIYITEKRLEFKRKQLENQLNAYGRDELTGMYNFREFNKNFLALENNSIEELTIFLIDIDYFKALNDSNGHEFGNRVLSFFGQNLREVIKQHYARPDYKVYRYGGEEFVVVVNGTCLNANIIVDEIRETIREKSIVSFNKEITFSVGVAFNVLNDMDNLATFEKADQMLYQVKKSGRNNYLIEK